MLIRSASVAVWAVLHLPLVTSGPSSARPPPSASGHSQASALASSASQPKRASPGRSALRRPPPNSRPWACRASRFSRR
nr:MAG TPA: hypothetical protein [Caudoviricetes sp.]